MSDGVHYRLYENESGDLEDSYLFWLIEYRKRNQGKQTEYAARLGENAQADSILITAEQPLESIYFSEDELPIFPANFQRRAEEIVHEIASGTFRPLVNSLYFEVPPSARLVRRPDSRPYIEFDPTREFSAIKYEVDLLLSYLYEKKKPAITAGEISKSLLDKTTTPRYCDFAVVTSTSARLNLRGRLDKRQAKDACRAIGLWLYDFINTNKCTQISAIRGLRQRLGPALTALGYAASEDTVFRRFYSKTKECIESCDVLPFK